MLCLFWWNIDLFIKFNTLFGCYVIKCKNLTLNIIIFVGKTSSKGVFINQRGWLYLKKRRKLNTNNVMIVLVFILMLSFCICIIVKSDLFDVKKIDVIGNKRVTKSNIMKELNVNLNENIFAYNFKDMKNKLIKNPYIENVEIKRKLPNKIIISLKEKEIFAVLKDEDNYCYIDKKEIYWKN